MRDEGRSRGSEDNVINIKEKIVCIGAATIDKERTVRATTKEIGGRNVYIETLIPRSRGLFQAVESLL